MKSIRICLLLLLILFRTGFPVNARAVTERRQARNANILYLNLTWHQHQPLYYQAPGTDVFSRPWVRVHATKDYYDMAAILEQYPEVKATFNLTPVLIKQLDAFSAGAKDKYWQIAEIPAEELNSNEKEFILRRFFDANHDNVIGRFPRYQSLLRKMQSLGDVSSPETQAAFSTREYRDLQVLFNLAWFDPDFLAQAPLATLVAKGKNYAEDDKRIVFEEVRRVLGKVLAVHRQLQDSRQIEVITTPYAHPILPLIFNTKIAQKNDPAAEKPNWFSYPQDASAHLLKSVELYEEKFGRKPRGLWPAEGAVAQEIVKLVADAGFEWMASGEHVLARSLGMDGFTRNSEDTVIEADDLYRPYYVRHKDGPKVAIVFRDLRLSDLLGFEYSGTPGELAAGDFMGRLEKIRTQLQAQFKKNPKIQGPFLVSVILDGENAWEHYTNDGKEFFHSLYRMLSESKTIKTTTVSDFIKDFPKQREIADLWPGAWFSSDYGTWIGEPEETRAWNVLGKVRDHLARYHLYGKRETTPEKLEAALDAMYLAEGSDWFWWYGSDQDSGVDEYFDTAYRQLLTSVYTALGDPVPDFLMVPIIAQQAEPPSKGAAGLFSPTVDGFAASGEWSRAGYYEAGEGVQVISSAILKRLSYGFNEENMYIKLDSREDWQNLAERGSLHLYFGLPVQKNTLSFVQHESDMQLIGFEAGLHLRIAGNVAALFEVGQWDQLQKKADLTTVAASGSVLEMSLPMELLADPETGDKILLRAFYVESAGIVDRMSQAGPMSIMVPETGASELLLRVKDPLGDDYGPGSYTYPTDSVFSEGAFDVTDFTVSRDKKSLSFSFVIAGSLTNPWGSGIDLSLQTFDIYIDKDPGEGTGSRLLLEGFGWEYAVWVEGWHQKILVPKDPQDPASRPVELSGSQVKVIADSGNRRVVVRIPLNLFGDDEDPGAFGFTAVLMSQEGYPAPGVRRIRDVEATASQWRLGGSPEDMNHTRIVDLVWPEGKSPDQQSILSDYPPSNEESPDTLNPESFARIPMILASEPF